MKDVIKTLIAAFVIGIVTAIITIFVSVSDLQGEVQTHQMVDYEIRKSIAKDINEIKNSQISILKFLRQGKP